MGQKQLHFPVYNIKVLYDGVKG